jgi:hypothetical protein
MADLRNRTADLNEMRVVELAENTGSAGGYRSGIAAAVEAMQADDELVWLLDDDNVPEEGALQSLVVAYRALEAEVSGPLGMAACRADDPLHRRLRDGVSTKAVFPRSSCFLNVNIVDVPARLRRRVHGSLANDGDARAAGWIDIPYGPYGGLLLSKGSIKTIGLPDSSLFLYEDDTYYTRRLVERGGRYVLVPDSMVVDIDRNWLASPRQQTNARTPWGQLLTAESPDRVYYAVRNRVAFERDHWCDSSWLRVINAVLYLTALVWTGLVTGRVRQASLILRAVFAARDCSFE